MKAEKKTISEYEIVITLSSHEAEMLFFALGHMTKSQDKRIDSPLDELYDLIKGVAGEFYPCKPDIFKATYEELP